MDEMYKLKCENDDLKELIREMLSNYMGINTNACASAANIQARLVELNIVNAINLNIDGVNSNATNINNETLLMMNKRYIF